MEESMGKIEKEKRKAIKKQFLPKFRNRAKGR
jgi:hypothetical protein